MLPSLPGMESDHGFDTIAAIATAVAPGSGSVAIVRISRSGAEAIGQQMFVAPCSQSWESHREDMART